MSDVNISPNMNLPVPEVGVEPGPDWASDINACMSAIDSHTHSSGQGLPVTPDGININSDLSFNNQNATLLRTTNFNAQSAVLSGAADIGCLYVVGKDLYYNDEDGNHVRITQGGAVSGSTGTITGLPSGTASASFSAGTFSFKSATNTPATMSVGPLVIGAAIANPKTVTLGANSSQPANYSTLLPTALPGSTSIMNCDTSGQQAFVAPDNTSFGLSGGTYQVLDGGLTTAKYANLSVTNAKLAAVNFSTAYSASAFSLTNTTAALVNNLSVTITGVGRPVLLMFCPSFNGAEASVNEQNSLGGDIQWQFRVNGSTISQFRVFIDIQNTNPFFSFIDIAPSVGSNTYEVWSTNIQTGRSFLCKNLGIAAVEF